MKKQISYLLLGVLLLSQTPTKSFSATLKTDTSEGIHTEKTILDKIPVPKKLKRIAH